MWRATEAILQIHKQESEAQRKLRLVDQNGVYKEPNDMSKSKSFQKVLTKGSMFEPTQGVKNKSKVWDIKVRRKYHKWWRK